MVSETLVLLFSVDAARPNFLSDETVFEDIYEIGFLILDV